MTKYTLEVTKNAEGLVYMYVRELNGNLKCCVNIDPKNGSIECADENLEFTGNSILSEL